MPELDKHDSPLPTTSVKWRFPSVHPEGRKYVVGAAFIAFLVYVLISHFLGWVLITVVAESLWLPTITGEGTDSMASAANFATVVLWGVAPSLWIVALSTATADLVIRRRPAIRVLFNSAAMVIVMAAAGTAFTLLGGPAHGIAPSDPGLAYGASVADGILALRQNDGAAVAGYVFVPPDAGTPGVWAPISAAASAQSLLPGWGSVAPFVLHSGSQFRPDAPPALDSERYARDLNEVRQVGSATGGNTGQQQIASFWRASPTALWNPILRKAIEFRGLDLSESARAAALFYLASSDASVACWEAKYFYNFWRPQPAIVNADLDGNAATTADPVWRPFVGTPPHPEYPSAHASNSGSMAFVLTRLFGDAPGFVIEATSSTAAGVVRYRHVGVVDESVWRDVLEPLYQALERGKVAP